MLIPTSSIHFHFHNILKWQIYRNVEWRGKGWGYEQGQGDGVGWLWKGKEGSRADGNVLCLDWITQHSGCDIALVFQDFSVRGNWVKGTQDLSVLFLTTTFTVTIISNSLNKGEHTYSSLQKRGKTIFLKKPTLKSLGVEIRKGLSRLFYPSILVWNRRIKLGNHFLWLAFIIGQRHAIKSVLAKH